MNTGSTFNFDGTYISVSGNGSYIDLNGFENYIDVSGFENYIALSGYNNYIGLEYGTYISFSDGSQIRDFMNSYGTAGQFLAPTSGSLQWTSVISKQMITTTGNDSISSATALTIYVVLLGTQATEILMFPTAGFDGQVVTINAAAAQTALTLVNGTFANAPTTLVAGQSQSFIWDANTSTWY